MNKEWEKWTSEQKKEFQRIFIEWYEKEKRNLPWRYNQDPYRIWISEIMLQQTRVDTVIDYCLLYTSDAADEEDSVDLGGRQILTKKKEKERRRKEED